MPGIMEIMQMCRLCLVKDQVNISIFDEKEDLRQIFLKITTCLPVKVEKDDKLPKKICDGCSYKLELLYQFVNTSVNAEKQLLTWLGETKKSSKSQEHPSVEAVVLKQEIVEPPEVMIVDTAQSSQNYVLQEENLPYESFEYEPSVDVSAAAALAEVDEQEMPSKRPRLAPSATVVSQGGEESDDDNGVEERIAKIENESEPDEDSVDAQQPQFISVASTSVSDQPGPSGVQKPVDPTSKRKPKVPLKQHTKNPGKIRVKEEFNLLHQQPKFTCHICADLVERTEQELRSHFKESHKDKRLRASRLQTRTYKCDICGKDFKSTKSLREHLELHDNQLNCPECDLSFRKTIDYVLHMRIHSFEDNFKCIYCDFQTDVIKDIREHMNQTHEDAPKYFCASCNKGFHILSWFQEHENFHSGARPFGCEFCDKEFLYSRHLAAHKCTIHKQIMKSVPTLHECVICKKQYAHRNSLKLHMNMHTGNTAVCDVCGKQLSNQEKLKFHMRIHTGYKPFGCGYCDKSFTKKTILVEHERTHTGEKPYKCTYCTKCFSQRSSVKIHERTHTGERPYVCHLCSKGFVARAMLNIHFKTCKGYAE